MEERNMKLYDGLLLIECENNEEALSGGHGK